jgi:hypothetical protein
MNSTSEHLKQLDDIRNIMERSSRFISLSGLSGVFAGFCALAGAAAFYVYVNQKIGYGYGELASRFGIEPDMDFFTFCFLDAGATLLAALAFGIFFTRRKAKADGIRALIWDKAALRFMINLFIPLATGGIFCLILLFRFGWFGIIAPCTLVFYGLALLNASKYSLDEIRWLGISEIILGLIGCLYVGYGVTLWALGFGVLHIIYGLIMYIRYEAVHKEKKYW